MFAIVAWMSLAGPGTAQVDSLFARANAIYNDGEFASAIELYGDILAQGYGSAALHYNLGNAYFKSKALGEAILHYERAIRLEPNNPHVKKNLEIAREMVDTEILEIPPFLPVRIWRSVALAVSGGVWILLQIIIGCALLCAGYFWLFDTETMKRRYGFMALPVLVFFFVFSYAASNSRDLILHASDEAIVMKDAPLYNAPDVRSGVFSNLSEGVKLQIIDTTDNWFKVKLLNQSEGWIENGTYFERINPG